MIDTFLFENELPDKNKPNSTQKFGDNYKHIFGCAKTETGEFFNQMADGIIGIGSEKFGQYSTNPPNIIETEFHQKRIPEKVFSICFGHNGGQMTFGDWNSDLHFNKTDPKRFNTIHTKDLGSYPWASQYRVPVYGVDVEGDQIDYDYVSMNKGRSFGEGAFFDSGTTFMYVAADFYRKLKTKMENFCSSKKEKCGGQNVGLDCYDYPRNEGDKIEDFFKTFPKINFDFGAERKYILYPEDYLVKPDSEYVYCVGIKTLKNMILGGIFWRNYDIRIDKEKKTVGFVRSTCNKNEKVTNIGQGKEEEKEEEVTRGEEKLG